MVVCACVCIDGPTPYGSGVIYGFVCFAVTFSLCHPPSFLFFLPLYIYIFIYLYVFIYLYNSDAASGILEGSSNLPASLLLDFSSPITKIRDPPTTTTGATAFVPCPLPHDDSKPDNATSRPNSSSSSNGGGGGAGGTVGAGGAGGAGEQPEVRVALGGLCKFMINSGICPKGADCPCT